MKLKTLALHLAYDIGSAAIGLAAEKLRSGIVQRQNAPKAQGNDLQEIKDPFESSPIKLNARVAIAGGKFDKDLLDRTATKLVDYAPKLEVRLDEDGRIAGFGHIDDPVSVGINGDGLYIKKSVIEPTVGTKAEHTAKLHVCRIALTEDDVAAINRGINSIKVTHGQKGPVAAINRADLTRIYSILLKLQHKSATN